MPTIPGCMPALHPLLNQAPGELRRPPPARWDVHAKVSEFVGELSSNFLQSLVLLCSDKDSLAVGEEVSKQVGNGVGLTGAGWALHDG